MWLYHEAPALPFPRRGQRTSAHFVIIKLYPPIYKMARPAKAGKSFKKATEKMNILHKKERVLQKMAITPDFAKE